MTEQEAKQIIQNFQEWNMDDRWLDNKKMEELDEVLNNALETMQELKQRNLTMENLEKYMQFEDECVKKGFSFKSLLEAREKQIAKKPIYSRLYATTPDMNCPVCNATLLTDEPNYCKRCGQKFNWGDEEE